MSSAEETGIVRKSLRWMKVVLVLSLMLNVVVIGAVGARAWMIHKHGHGFHAMRMLGVHSFLRKLPKERRQELRGKFRQVRKELREHGRSLMGPLRNLATAMAADNYDRSQVETAVKTFRQTHEQRAAAREKYMMELIDALTPEERKTLGRKILKRAERREKWHRRFKD